MNNPHPEDNYARALALAMKSEGDAEPIIKSVMRRIDASRVRRARIRIGVFGVLTLGTLGTMIPAIGRVASGASQTGFAEYVSLVSSEGLSVFRYWKSLGSSLIESIPIAEITVLTAIILIFACSIRSLVVSLSSVPKHYHQSI